MCVCARLCLCVSYSECVFVCVFVSECVCFCVCEREGNVNKADPFPKNVLVKHFQCVF